MCKVDAPEVKTPKPQYLRNPFLDESRSGEAMVESLRVGRNSLRIPLQRGLGIGFGGRGSSQSTSGTAGPKGNARPSSNAIPNSSGSLRIPGGSSGGGRTRPRGGGNRGPGRMNIK